MDEEGERVCKIPIKLFILSNSKLLISESNFFPKQRLVYTRSHWSHKRKSSSLKMVPLIINMCVYLYIKRERQREKKRARHIQKH